MSISKREMLTHDPELEAIFKKHGRPKPFLPTLETLPRFRKVFSQATKRFLGSPFARNALDADKPPTWTEEDHALNARDGISIPIRIYRPKVVSSAGLPVMVVLHGGGWCMGDLDTEAFLCKLLCHRLGILIFNIAYRLYPDVKFPVPIYDSHDGVRWVAENAARFGGDCGKGFIVGGNSGGATFASIIAHLARDDGMTPKITGQFLACPILTDETVDENGKYYRLFPGRYPSQDENWNAPLQDRATKERMRELSQVDLRSHYTTSFLFESHDRLPPVYTQVCGLDPWRDGGIIYNDLAEQQGSKSKIDIYAGMPHCWWNTYPMLSRTQKWKKDTVEGVRWLLEQSQLERKLDAKL
jgi:acetyl esterase/lipase